MLNPSESTEDALIPWRARCDLIARSSVALGESGWTMKDPLSLSYFHLRDAEYTVFTWLDGRVTYRDLLERLRQRFPTEFWSLENLRGFLTSLIQSGLLISLTPGQGRQIARRQELDAKRRRWSWLTGFLSLRWKGIDPDPWLKRLTPWTNWLFRPAALMSCLALIGWALALIVLRWEQLVQRLPDAQSLLGLENLISLTVLFVSIKLLHELGHVLTCRHFGGECHELGIQWILFVPLFYGDVTDAWMQSRRWPRVAISGAGVFVELVLAALATVLWWLSVPGLLNSIFLNVMLICSINTLLFNGNPLLRYDGYYLLADGLNIPNLGQQARRVAMSIWERGLLGVCEDSLETNSRRWWWLAFYGFASAAYRGVILVTVLWFLHSWLAPYGLSFVATTMSIAIVGSAITLPVRELVRHARELQSAGRLTPQRWRRGVIGFCGILAAILLVPLPLWVRAPFVTFPADAQPVFVSVAGRLQTARAIGQSVGSGDTLAELVNHDLQRQLEQQRSLVNKLETRLRSLEAQRSRSELAAARIPTTRDELTSAQRRLEQLASEVERLRIVSPSAGTILPPPNVVREITLEDKLPQWSGFPQSPENWGATLHEQTMLCFIGDARRHDALLLVEQDSVEFLKVGQPVRLQFTSAPSHVSEGTVIEIASARAENVPRELEAAKLAIVRQTAHGSVPAEVSYEVRVRLTGDNLATLYSPGRAKIACGWQSLSTRLWRLLRHTFSADLSSATR